FPNHPADPIQPENLVALQRRIVDTGADVGLAFDGDADRCFLVDDKGVPVSGSTTTALPASATPSSRRSWPTPTPSSAGSIPGTTTSRKITERIRDRSPLSSCSRCS